MSLRYKLSIMFLAIAAIPLLLVSALTYFTYRHSLETSHLSQLKDIAAFKADKIETYFDGLKINIEVAQGYYNIQTNLPILNRLADSPQQPEFQAAKTMLDRQLRHLQAVRKLADIMLVNPQGRIVYASNPADFAAKFLKPLPDPGQRLFEQAKRGICLSDIFVNPAAGNRFEVLAAGPARDVNGQFVGVIAYEVDMAAMFDLIQSTAGLGKTGETLLGAKQGDTVVFLNPLRHDPGAALKRTVTIGDPSALPIQQAVQGKTAVGRSVDYRGADVVAAWRYLPSLGWGMVAKVDTAEAFSDVTKLRNMFAGILLVVLIISALMAFHIARSITEPLKRLSEGAAIIGHGNLDYKVATAHKDEVGQLSRSFDKMTAELKQTVETLQTEVTHRMAAEQKAVDERQRFLDVLETLPVYVCLLTPEYGMPFANRVFREWFGYDPNRKCHEFLFDRADPCETCETFSVLKTGRPHHWEWTGPNGRDYDIFDFPFKQADGSKLILEMGIDITERKQAQAALQAASLYNRGLLEASLDPLVTISAEGKITDVNEATVKVTGVLRDRLIGTDFSNYFTEPDKARKGYQQVFAEGFVTDYPLTIQHADGHLIDVLYNAAVYKDPAGNVAGVFAAARDVTEKKAAEAELERYRLHLEDMVRQRTEELARSNRDLEQFAYVASHDLQEPLRAVMGFVDLLRRSLHESLDEKTAEYMHFIVDGSRRMQALINGLLEYSRVGTQGKQPTKIDTQKAFDEAIARLQTSIRETGAVITADPLPTLYFDRIQLSQLFQNLIGNALKFRGPDTPRIHISAVRRDDGWQFAVADNGIGIEPQYAEKIFLIFQRLHSRQKYPGTGIGLAICKKIVERHYGKIWVESVPGSGTTFYFTVPDTPDIAQTGQKEV